jgi:hypothetical protein
VTVLAVADELAGDGRIAMPHPAELAHEHVPRAGGMPVQVDVLARQRCAPTVGTAIPVGLQGAEATAQQATLEPLDIRDRERHDEVDFAATERAPAMCPDATFRPFRRARMRVEQGNGTQRAGEFACRADFVIWNSGTLTALL